MVRSELRPMLAALADAPLEDASLVYEPKYDGMRTVAEAHGGSGRAVDARVPFPVRLWSRLGNDKTSQFPEVADALATWARRLTAPVVLDGEIVALDARGRPAGFQALQRRIHAAGAPAPSRVSSRPRSAVAYIVFDLLREGSHDLRDRPLVERRAALERLLGPIARSASGSLRLGEMVRAHGTALYKRALAEGWEGLIAKRADSPYRSGRRTPDWRKLKILREEEFVVGGWTQPRGTRLAFGALLLGVYEKARGARSRTASPRPLTYVGRVGTGFTQREIARLMQMLKPLETSSCPFSTRPSTSERSHWVRPQLVAEVRFTEWTAEGRLRQPVYLGLRDDKRPEDVTPAAPRATGATGAGSGFSRIRPGATDVATGSRTDSLIDQLRAIEQSRRPGTLVLPDGDRLDVNHLHKVFWPARTLTKGDLLRYYVEVAPYLLPAVADRPLVMKRYPNGVTRPFFFQHRIENAPAGVRVERLTKPGVPDRDAGFAARGGSREDEAPAGLQLVGGHLKTLLYMAQLAAISQDPWFSRVGSLAFADHAVLDLDPAPGVTFRRVLDVARWIRDELDALGATAIAKTSGADGLHVCVPLPPRTPYEAGLLFCRIVATIVASKHPGAATVERRVAARGARVYIDCLQNVLGRTLATAYSARASDWAGVSTPLTWQEIDDGVRREEFTIRTVPGRLAAVGDLWSSLRTATPVDLSRVARL